jgi:F-type H+-transporting ATPase subunit b
MEALGINLQWFLFQTGNFIILFIGLTYILHKPLLTLLQKRQEEIERGLTNAKRAEEELSSTKEQQAALLEETRKESAALLRKTQEQAVQLEQKLTAQAEERASELKERSMQELEAERIKLHQDLKSELAEMVVAATAKALQTAPGKEKATKEQIQRLN